MKTREFLEVVRSAALESMTDEKPDCILRGSLVQFHFGDPQQHYEVWLRRQAGVVEVGLHFEGDRADNLARIAVVAEAMPVIAATLGPRVEVEEWTERWTRVHETVVAPVLTSDFASELGRRVAEYASILEPIVRELGPMRPAAARHHGPRTRGHRTRA